MEFLRSLLRRRFARAQVVTSRNIGCFLRLHTQPRTHTMIWRSSIWWLTLWAPVSACIFSSLFSIYSLWYKLRGIFSQSRHFIFGDHQILNSHDPYVWSNYDNVRRKKMYLATVLVWELLTLLLTKVVGVRSTIVRPLLDRLLPARTWLCFEELAPLMDPRWGTERYMYSNIKYHFTETKVNNSRIVYYQCKVSRQFFLILSKIMCAN